MKPMKIDIAVKSALIALVCVAVFLITYTVIMNSSSNTCDFVKDSISTSVPEALTQGAEEGKLGSYEKVMYGCEFLQPEIKELSKNYLVFYGQVNNCQQGNMYVGCGVKTPLNKNYITDLSHVVITTQKQNVSAEIKDTSIPFVKAVINISFSEGMTPEAELTTTVNVVDIISCVIVYAVCFYVAYKKISARADKKAQEDEESK